MQNFQAFLNQILFVLHKEQDLLNKLNNKQQEITTEYLQLEDRIELIKKNYSKTAPE